MANRLMTIAEVAEILRCTPSKLYLWRHLQTKPQPNRTTPDLVFTKLGGQLYVRAVDLESFINGKGA